MEDILDAYLEGLTKIANTKKVMEICEPSIMEPLRVEKWMVLRALTAQKLFEEEANEIHG